MFTADNPHRFIGQSVGNGHCVAFARAASGAPHTSAWRRGARVRGNKIASGTAIATFGLDDRYANDTTGQSHAAIFLSEVPKGLRVLDQWVGKPVHQRTLYFRNGKGKPVNDGDRFYVVTV